MSGGLLALIILGTIVCLMALISLLFAASVFRRVMNRSRYLRLDRLRAAFRETLSRSLAAAPGDPAAALSRPQPRSLEWQALEDVLLEFMDDAEFAAAVQPLFGRLGYVGYYEKRITSGNPITAAAAIDKLGRMRSKASAGGLIARLGDGNPEIASVTVRSLGRIGSPDGLRSLVEGLPELLRSGRVTVKALETAVLNFGPSAVPVLLDRHEDTPDAAVAAFVLGALSRFPADTRAVFLAVEHLKHPDSEVRSRALRVLARSEQNLPAHLPSLVLPLLQDPVWFVRLQAARAAGALGCEQAAEPLGKLIFDSHWRVRGEAALALARLGDCAVDVFHDALTQYDTYAKEGVCEEIERAGFTRALIEHLAHQDAPARVKAREILTIMRSLGFSATLAEYAATAGDGRPRQIAREILAGGGQ